MSPASPRLCPQAGCGRALVVSTRREMETGAPLWRCGGGHRGPLLVGSGVDDD